MLTKTTTNDDDERARLLARLVRSLEAEEAFHSIADVAEALKVRCARLHIRTTPEAMHAACALARLQPAAAPPLPEAPRAADLSPAEAGALLDEIRRHTGAAAVIRSVPAASAPPDAEALAEAEQAARARAWEMGVEL